MSPANGQVFQIIAHNVPGSADTATTPLSLSSASLRSIFTGQYHSWKQVPEIGALDTVTTTFTVGGGTFTGTPINICRRDHGSGTELSADMAFTGNSCGLQGANPILSGTVATYNLATPPWVYEAPATPDMKACVQSANGTIGFVTNSTKDAAFNYRILYVDGFAPSAHNAAAGWYPYAFEINMAATGSGSGDGTSATTLVNDAKNYTKLNISSFQEAGAVAANGGYVASTLGSSVLYAIPTVDGQSPARTAAQWATDLLAEGMFNRNGNSCGVRNDANK
jgi:ABC-type phosphate transport system substrate-binding protein